MSLYLVDTSDSICCLLDTVSRHTGEIWRPHSENNYTKNCFNYIFFSSASKTMCKHVSALSLQHFYQSRIYMLKVLLTNGAALTAETPPSTNQGRSCSITDVHRAWM